MNFYDMKGVFVFASALIFLGCAENKKSAVEPNAFFDIDSLLSAQISMFSDKGYNLHKTVEMNGNEEQALLQPDSAGWAQEFVIIRDFDLNKPNNVGAYRTDKSANTIRYELTADIDAPVKVLEVVRQKGDLAKITSNYFEDKSIYQHRRNLTLEFEGGLLKHYRVKGFQKMILKDTIHYVISGEVVAK